MNNPKIYLIALFTCSLLLAFVLWLKPQPQAELINAKVISQTLTQSLDGHRRYLNVVTDQNHTILVQLDAKVDCPKDSQVTIQQEQSLFSDVLSYTVIKCSN